MAAHESWWVSNHNKLWLIITILCISNSQRFVRSNQEIEENNLLSRYNNQNSALPNVQHENIEQQALSKSELSNAKPKLRAASEKLKPKHQSKWDMKMKSFERYKHFYVESSDRSSSSADESRQSHNKELLLQSESLKEREEEARQQMIEHLPKHILVMDRLWYGVRNGIPPPAEIVDYKTSEAVSYKEIVQIHLTEGNIVEIGSGNTALDLAYTLNSTIMAVTITDHLYDHMVDAVKMSRLKNLYLGTVDPEDLPSIIDEMYSDHRILLSNLMLTNLTSMMGTLLPHEFEELLGRLLALSSQTFVTNLHTLCPNQMSYFNENWENLESLLKRGCRMAGLACSVRLVDGNGGWDGRIDRSFYKVTVFSAVRPLPDTLCDALRHNTQCQLEYSRKSENTTVRFSDGTYSLAPVMPDGLSIYFILKMGCTPYSRDHLFLQSLLLPYSPDSNIYSLMAYAGTIVLYETDDDEVDLDVYEDAEIYHQKVAALTEDRTQVFETDNTQFQPKRTTLIINHPTVEVIRSPHNPDLGRMSTAATGRGSTVNSQVDGVAQRWDRIEGEVPTGSERDQDQVKHMSQHWDRENIEGLAGADPLQAQAQQELDKLEKAWNREKQVGEHDFEESIEKKDIVKVRKTIEQRSGVNNDAVLRVDEKDLRQAMGFLHGNSDVREISKMTKSHQMQKSRQEQRVGQGHQGHLLTNHNLQIMRQNQPSTKYIKNSNPQNLDQKRSNQIQNKESPQLITQKQNKFFKLQNMGKKLNQERKSPERQMSSNQMNQNKPVGNIFNGQEGQLYNHRQSNKQLDKTKNIDNESKYNVNNGNFISNDVQQSKNRVNKKGMFLQKIVESSKAKTKLKRDNTLRFEENNFGNMNDEFKTVKNIPMGKIQMIEEFDPDIPGQGIEGDYDRNNGDYEKSPDFMDIGQNAKDTVPVNNELNKELHPKDHPKHGENVQYVGQQEHEEDPDDINYEEEDDKENYDEYEEKRGQWEDEEREEEEEAEQGEGQKVQHKSHDKKDGNIRLERTGMRRLLVEEEGLPLTNTREDLDAYASLTRENVDTYASLTNLPAEENNKLKKVLQEIHSKRTKENAKDFKGATSQGFSPQSETKKHSTHGDRDQSITPVDREDIAKAITDADDDEEDGFDFEDDDDYEEFRFDQQVRMVAVQHGRPDREQSLYDYQWQQLRSEFQADLGAAPLQPFTAMVYGGRRQSLLGVKLARKYASSNILTIMPSCGQSEVLKHRRLVRSIGVKNNIVLSSRLTVSVVNSLYKLPHLTRYQVLGLDIYESVLQLGSGYLIYLGHILSLARTTFLEVPDPRQILLLQQLLESQNSISKNAGFFKGLVYEALRMVKAEVGEIQMLDDTALPSIGRGLATPLKILRIDIHTLSRKVRLDCGDREGLLKLQPDGVVTVAPSHSSHHYPLPATTNIFTLQALFKLGLLRNIKERKRVFTSYLTLPLYADMCPVHVIWTNSSVFYRPLTAPGLPGISIDKLHEAKVIINMLQQNIHGQHFSFVDYNGWNGTIVTALARKYRNATFVAMVNNNAEAATMLYENAKEDKLNNLVVTNLTLDHKFTAKMVESPEFFRYQYVDFSQFLKMVQGMASRRQFNRMIGQMLASSVTTFLQLPSAQMLSHAMSLFFPNSYHGLPQGDIMDTLVYKMNQHPTPVYENAEFKIVGQSAHAMVNITVKGEVLTPPVQPGGAQYPWTLLRIDVTNLTVQVHHHFDYAQDGHGRKYTLHCLSTNKTHYEVYLIRMHDGYRIPYGNVEAVTLIALLRMGLLADIKKGFYDKFVHLPLYEDMAPWNIVFKGGNLEYIDFDTKDHNLNKIVPAAFQVIFMLLNYERTVKDFGKCKGNAKVLYGLDFVGRCVAGVFHGPCEDTRYPVPCGDHTCRSTFIECLQALNHLELKKAAKHQQVLMDVKAGFPIIQDMDSDFTFSHGEWSFNEEGVKIPQKKSISENYFV